MSCSMQKLLHDTLTPICQDHGLTLQQLHVLVELIDKPSLTAGQLSERAGILRTNFSGVCRKLEQRGLIERAPNQTDGRSYVLRTTDEGKALLVRLNSDIEQRYGAAFQEEPPETFDTIIAGFQALSTFAEKLGR